MYRFNCKIITSTCIFLMLLIIKTLSAKIWGKILTKSYLNGDQVLRRCLLPPHFLRCFLHKRKHNYSHVLVVETYTIGFSNFRECPWYLKNYYSWWKLLCIYPFSVNSWSKKGLTLRHSTTWLAIALTDCFYRRGLDLKPYIG